MKLQQYRSKAQAFPDLLNYAAVIDDGIVLGKDGSLTAGWFYRGEDLATVSNDERNAIATRMNSALARLGNGWCLHQDVIRFKSKHYPQAEDSHFPDMVSRLIDEERRLSFEGEGNHFDNIYAITLTYLPEKQHQQRLADMMFDDEDNSAKKSVADIALNQFKSQIEDFADRLSSVLKLHRLRGIEFKDELNRVHIKDELLAHINFCIKGELHPIILPSVAMYLDAVIGSHEFYFGVIPKIGDKYIQTISIDSFPAECYPGILSALSSLPCEYRFNSRFIFQDQLESEKALNSFKKKWQLKTRGFLSQIMYSKNTYQGSLNQDALAMVQQAETAISEAQSGLVVYGYYSPTIILMSENREEIEHNARMIKKLINNMGFNARIETVNNVEAYLGSLPSHVVQNLRRPLMNTMHMADLLPLSAVWEGSEYAPCPFYPPKSPPLLYAATDGSTPYRFNLHVGDLGHTLMLGPTGAGKSTAIALIASQFLRYPNANIFAFDKGRSLEALCRGVGGNHYDVGNLDSKDILSFSPLSCIEDQNELLFAKEWVENCCTLQGLTLTPSQRNLILDALKLLQNDPEKTITNLVINIQDTDIKEALKDYTLDGAYGSLLDSMEDGLNTGHFSVFEIEELMNLDDRAKLPVLLYLFRVIERQLTGQPTLLILDEAWLMLSHPVFKEKIREWLKVMRKSNCAVLLATQSLTDVVKSGIADVLNESCPTKIFLANNDAVSEDNRPIYKNMGCNDTEIEIIANMEKKRDYFIKSPEGKRRINFGIGPITLSFIGCSDKESIATIRQLNNEYGENWFIYWLDQRGINYQQALENCKK